MTVFLTIVHVFGLITMGCGGLMSTSLITSAIAKDGATDAFLEGTLLTLLLGALMFFHLSRHQKSHPPNGLSTGCDYLVGNSRIQRDPTSALFSIPEFYRCLFRDRFRLDDHGRNHI